jgi:hypothetical protein
MARSFVDLPTNVGLIGRLTAAANLGHFHAANLPADVLPLFLHEVTHHWCFHSSLGMAMAVCFERASALSDTMTAAIRGGLEQKPSLSPDIGILPEALQNLTRFEVLWTLLSPLIEGLALFCEYDVQPMQEHEGPMPMRLAAQLFAAKEGDTLFSMNERFRNLLSKVRGSTKAVEGKWTVLCRPLRPSMDPYVAGYLSIKSSWSIAANFCPALSDSSKFFIFVRNYVFEDLEMVRILLEDNFSGPASMPSATALATRLGQRLEALKDSTTYDQYPAHEAALDMLAERPQSQTEPFPPAVAMIKDVEAKPGWNAIMRSVEDFRSKSQSGSEDAYIWNAYYAALAERDLLILDISQAHIKVSKSGICSAWASSQSTIPFLTGIQCANETLFGTEDSGHIAMLVSPVDSLAFFALVRNGEIVFDTLPNAISPQVSVRLRSAARYLPTKMMISEMSHRNLNAYFRQEKTGGIAWPLSGIDEALDSIYLGQALYWLSKEEQQQAGIALSEPNAGMSALLPENKRKLFGCFVSWSLGAGLSSEDLDLLFSEMSEEESILDVLTRVNGWAQSVWHHDLVHVIDAEKDQLLVAL